MNRLHRIASGVITFLGRCMLPFSFVIAVIIAPHIMLPNWRFWPEAWAQLWDDPL